MKRFLAWLFVIVVPFILLPQSRGERERELSQIRTRLAEVKKEIASLKREEKGVLKEIHLLEEQVSLTRRLLTGLRLSEEATEAQIDSLEGAIASLELGLRVSKDNLRNHLVSLYRRGQFYDLELVFGAKSVAEVYDRIYFTRYVARAENRLFTRLLEAKHTLEANQDSLEVCKKEINSLIAEKKTAQDSLVSARRGKEQRLSKIKGSRRSKERLQNELAERKRQLESLLASVNKESSASPGRKPTGTVIEKGKGNLPWPVSSRKVIAGYGTIVHPRYGTETFNDGVDIDCSGGQSVKAIKGGKVRVAGLFSGYGLLVILDHEDGYYTIYGNLDQINVSKGQSVAQGEVVGSASDYLHFSITRGTDFLNPINYLK